MKAKNLMTPLAECLQAGGEKAIELASSVNVPDEASLTVCVNRMLEHKVNLLPVLDKNNEVVGILYGRDVFLSAISVAFLGVLAVTLWSIGSVMVVPLP